MGNLLNVCTNAEDKGGDDKEKLYKESENFDKDNTHVPVELFEDDAQIEKIEIKYSDFEEIWTKNYSFIYLSLLLVEKLNNAHPLIHIFRNYCIV